MRTQQTVQTVLFDGSQPNDTQATPIFSLLHEVLLQKTNKVKVIKLYNINLTLCTSCFHCFFKTPGQCRNRNDMGAELLKIILNSSTIVLFTPVVFGGYSSDLKKLIDRFLPIVLPFFKKVDKETHHPLRYSTFPHIIGIGVHPHPTKELSNCFKTLVGRNALNLPPSHYSTEVINSTSYFPQEVRKKFQDVLARTERLPLYKDINLLLQENNPSFKKVTKKKQALLIIGSQKDKKSTSNVLAACLAGHLKNNKIGTVFFKITDILHHSEGLQNLCAAIDRADTIILACPLYFDSLPFLVTKAFETIATHRKKTINMEPKIFLAIINNAFPESHQNAVALAICKNFALEANMLWAGGLTLGTGEGLISGKSLIGIHGFAGFKRPPLFYISRSLKLTARSLAKGHPVPEKAAQIMAKIPYPFMSSARWRTFIIQSAKRLIEQEAQKNGLNVIELQRKPYAQ
ncbi:MAG: hypothetical protein D3921_05750 [Candidatus Electrothrix sp. AW1]|nr:hypothetical protein [Candidatus Electrothrix sp. AX1]MCI5182006.1 hypothetical protein [Candidatus Electrothrix gigas]